MPLLNIVGVEHLPNGVNVGALTTCYGLQYSGIEAYADWTGNNTNYPNVAHLRPDGANLTYAGQPVNGNNGSGVVSISLKSLMNGPVTPDRLFISFRWTKLVALNAVSSMPIFSLLSARYGPGNGGIPANPIITDNGEPVGSTHYYTLDMNFTTLKYTVYRDGAAMNATPLTLPSGCTKASVQTWWWAIGRYDTFTFTTANDYKLYNFRDIHVIADTGLAGDTMNVRLDDLVVRRVPLVSASGNGFTAVNGATSITDALNTRRTSNAMTTPSVTVPATADELVCKLDPSYLTGVQLKGLAVCASSFKDSSIPGQITAKARANGVSSAVKTLTTTPTSTPVDQSVSVMTVRPDGGELTSSTISALELVFAHSAT